MGKHNRERVLTEEEQADIRSYCAAHRWSGHRSAIARKYGIQVRTVASVVRGTYFRHRIHIDMAAFQSENGTYEAG